ncbi:HEPN domain-containing protein [Shewanella baltica]|uniref:HEPN domain-containing protein n=1 Tax=Shewanella baltica TaxID=62322 RepID=UPI003D7AAEA3
MENEAIDFIDDTETLEKEINDDLLRMDESNELLDISVELICSIENFNNNMECLAKTFHLLTDDKNNPFLKGTILAGIISAFEGFVHELFKIFCNKPIYISRAMENIRSTPKPILNKSFKLQKVTSEKTLKNMLLNSTFNDPVTISFISELLFKLNMPPFDKEYTRSIIEKRNAFTHKNGIRDDCYVSITYDEILAAYDHYFDTVKSYRDTIENHALDQIPV